MNSSDKHIVDSYAGLLKGLSDNNKKELIESLTKSLQEDSKNIEVEFYKSFGAFASEETPKKIINEIKANRKFKKKEIQF